MKMLARIICVSLTVAVPAGRISADDDVQTPSLFDQVREAIPKLKPGMKIEEVQRILQTAKMGFPSLSMGIGGAYFNYTVPGKPNQCLIIKTTALLKPSDFVFGTATLYDGERVVAKSDADKK